MSYYTHTICCISATLIPLRQSYCLDCRNHGASRWADTMYLSELAEDVVTFARQHGLEKFNIVGHR